MKTFFLTTFVLGFAITVDAQIFEYKTKDSAGDSIAVYDQPVLLFSEPLKLPSESSIVWNGFYAGLNIGNRLDVPWKQTAVGIYGTAMVQVHDWYFIRGKIYAPVLNESWRYELEIGRLIF